MTAERELHPGQSDPCVPEMKRLVCAWLNTHGHKHAATQIDQHSAVYGPGAQKGVRCFQAANHLAADGVVGPNTWAALHGRRPATHPVGGHSVGDRIVALARTHLGEHETPPGTNRGPLPDHVLDAAHCPRENPWCMAFATDVVILAGGNVPGGRTAGCGTGRVNAQKAGKWHPAGTVTPKRGWIGIRPGDEHAVIVIDPLPHGIHQIAGNTSMSDGANPNGGCVAEHDYSSSMIAGYIETC